MEKMRSRFCSRLAESGKLLVSLSLTLALSLSLVFLTACSESEDETADEFANWQQRNEAYFDALEARYQAGAASAAWLKLKNYTKDPATQGAAADYVYVEVLQTGDGTESPLFTDSVRVAYRGRIIPSDSYPEGYVFDQTYTGDYSPQTTGVRNMLMYTSSSALVDGFSTALQHMHRGDRWRVYIPWQLGYGASGSSSPARRP